MLTDHCYSLQVDRIRAHYESKCRQADEAEDDARFAGGEISSPSYLSSDSDVVVEKKALSPLAEKHNNSQPEFSSQDEEKTFLDPDRLKRRETLREQFGFQRGSGQGAEAGDKNSILSPRSVSAGTLSTQSFNEGSSGLSSLKRSSTLSSALSSAFSKASVVSVPALQNLRAAVGVLNEPKHLRLRKEAETSEVQYKEAVRNLDKVRCELEEILLTHFDLTEKWEGNRLLAVQRVLGSFNAAFVPLLPSLSSSLQRSSSLEKRLDPKKSLTHLIYEARTGPYQPEPQVFHPYYHDDSSNLSGAGTAGFGMDLIAFMRAETLASESGESSGGIRAGAGDSHKLGMPAIPLAFMALLASLERLYDDPSRWKVKGESSASIVNGEKRKSWIYEVPLLNIHICREAIISHLLGKSVPGADVGAGLETKLKRFDPPTLASTAKLWAMELTNSLITSDLWDSVDNTYRAAASQEYDARVTPSKTVGEAIEEESAKKGDVAPTVDVKGKGRAEGLDPVLEETIRKGVLADLSVILSRLPKIHLVCLDALIGHLSRLIKATPVEESDSIYLNKLALSLGRIIIRPSTETASTLRSRAPILLAHDLIKYYDDLLPKLLDRKAKESEAAQFAQRRTPIRKRTKPVDQRMSRSRMVASSAEVPLPVPSKGQITSQVNPAPAPALAIPPKLEIDLKEEETDESTTPTPIGSRILANSLAVKEEDPSRVKSPSSISASSSSAYNTPDEADDKAAVSPSLNTIADEDKPLSNVARLSRQFGSSGSVKSMVRGPRAAGTSTPTRT